MKVEVKAFPVRLGAGLSVPGYAVICDSNLHEWYKTRTEADRMAEILKTDSENPEDY